MSHLQNLKNTPMSEETRMAVKAEVVDIFSELLQSLWNRIVGVIGESPTSTIFNGALWETSQKYTFLTGLSIDSAGVHIETLIQNLNQIDHSELRAGMTALVGNTVGLLTDMTGTILMNKVDPLLQKFKRELEE